MDGAAKKNKNNLEIACALLTILIEVLTVFKRV